VADIMGVHAARLVGLANERRSRHDTGELVGWLRFPPSTTTPDLSKQYPTSKKTVSMPAVP